MAGPPQQTQQYVETESAASSGNPAGEQEKLSPNLATLPKPRFRHKSNKGIRLRGWEDWNVKALAAPSKCSYQHLRQVLSGRDGASMRLIERVAKVTGMGVGEVADRIQAARAANAVWKKERQARAGKRGARRKQAK